MTSGKRLELYYKLPIPLQNLATSFQGAKIQKTRFGQGFQELLDEFESHLAWTDDQLFEWRDKQMRKLVRHAYLTVPHYRKVMDDGGIDPGSIRTADDLRRLPIVTKQMIKDNPEEFRSSEINKLNIIRQHTSGTTGSSFTFDSTLECQQAQFACFWRCYRKHGLSFDTWCAQFNSQPIVPFYQPKPPYWRIDRPGTRYLMSIFHESNDNLAAYYELIKSKRIPWLTGYPSALVLLSKWMESRGLSFDFIKAVSCGSESLLDHQKESIINAFGVSPIDIYGQAENVAIATQFPDGHMLVNEDYSVVEFENLGDSRFEIIGTSLFNFATPLIRYKTNDVVQLVKRRGVWREIKAIDGRKEDYIVLPDSRKIGRISRAFHSCSNIVEAQVVQKGDLSIVLKLVGDGGRCIDDEAAVIKALRELVGHELPISVEYVDHIPRAKSGKFRFVVSEVC